MAASSQTSGVAAWPWGPFHTLTHQRSPHAGPLLGLAHRLGCRLPGGSRLRRGVRASPKPQARALSWEALVLAHSPGPCWSLASSRTVPRMDEIEAVEAPEPLVFPDPCASLDSASFLHILSLLDASSLARASAVCKAWRGFAVQPRIWSQHCQELWTSKAYVSAGVRAHPNAYEAYNKSMEDANRTCITMEELTSITWSFKFKHTMGPFWASLLGTYQLFRWFHEDYTMTGPRRDPLYHDTAGEGGYLWCFLGPDGDPDPGLGINEDDEEQLMEAAGEGAAVAAVALSEEQRQQRRARQGHFVQVNQYPPLVVSRLPHNWSWRMENMWVVFDAVLHHPNPGRGKEPEHSSELSQQQQLLQQQEEQECEANYKV